MFLKMKAVFSVADTKVKNLANVFRWKEQMTKQNGLYIARTNYP